ncbi:MAG: S26 family signal peptidase [Thermoplasmata archaeon]|nr:S26 family signal peptidase [Thermoplasmata archaeon]
MARRTPSSEDDEESDSEEEEDERPSRRRRSRPPSQRGPRGRPKPIRRWSRGGADAPEEDSAEDGDDDNPDFAKRARVFWRARDSLYFGPLVALAIVVLLVVSLFAFTQNWPPVYVVESDSMQHGYSDVVGLINTGDLVLAQKIPNSTIQTYVVGRQTGYTTYGEYGDVLLYQPNGVAGTPIIHRAILYLQWVPSLRAYDALGLAGLPCGNQPGAVYATPGTPSDCGTTSLTNTIDLMHIGWEDANLSIPLQSSQLGGHSGFVTMGDNNVIDGMGCYDQSSCFPLGELVEPGWVLGVARGMIPWVGALKLWAEQSPTTGEIPSQSWQFLGLTIAGLILLAFGLHFALRKEGIEDPRRKAAEEEEASEDAEERDERGESRTRRFLHSLRPWGNSGEEDADSEEDEAPPHSLQGESPRSPRTMHRGRPKPRVRRGSKSQRSRRGEDGEL